ncbi:MAG: putative toxin-antitoxin system toxin component, PIN family [Microscillaceae bacterium]|nr:putative toxin-antitoxin system toxin component, PIN family [Microscillaceae bacterium]
MKIVLDTNILVSSLSSRSKYHAIYQALVEGKYDLYLTSDILLEYEEIISQKYGNVITQIFLDLIHEAPNVHQINVYYQWEFITLDKDDNKYVDCAIGAGADYLVSEDRHFQVLKMVVFPKVQVISIADFVKLLADG